jgi:hypothetical protein
MRQGLMEKAAIDQWMKDIAPSAELRKWFGHDPARWEEFRRRYAEEVHHNPGLLDYCVPWHGKVRSRSYIRPMTRCTTMPLC